MKTIKNTLFMLKQVAVYTPAFFVFTVIEGIVWGCIHSFTSVLFVKLLFDKIGNYAPFQDVIILVLLMAGFLILTYLFHEWYWQFIEPRARQELHKRMQEKLFVKAKDIDLACYDNPDFYTDFVWAVNEADSRAIRVAEDMGKIINRLFSSTVIIGILFTIDIWIVVAICFSVIVTVVLKLIRTKIQFNRDQQLKPIQRKSDYVSRVYYLTDYAKELRLSHASDILNSEFQSSIRKMISVIRKYGAKIFFIGTARSISTSMLFDVGIILLLTYKIAVEQTITLGDFAASVGATWKLFWQINNLMDYLANFKEHSLYSEKFRKFINYTTTVCDHNGCRNAPESFTSIELKNVSFRYPGTSKKVLNNICMTIQPKQKIAIVGYNAAGKSTLIKLLLRLYDPTSGSITMNKEDIRNLTLKSYREKYKAVFQDYQIYAASLGENVAMDCAAPNNQFEIISALNKSGFGSKFNSLPYGTETQLTKEFTNEGELLSGGESQKVAISRVCYQQPEIVILDEPSSALDPISEYELNQTMLSSTQDKTVIFISHRLSTTRMADVIYMLENGEIIEQGTHLELMALNGKYAAMFQLQAEKYN